MSIPPRIIELRLSFAWSEVFASFADVANNSAPLAALSTRAGYIKRYEEIQREMLQLEVRRKEEFANAKSAAAGNAREFARRKHEIITSLQALLKDADRLTLPWPRLGRKYIHRFWQFYLKNTEPDLVEAPEAWEHLVPFRVNVPMKIIVPAAPGRPEIRAFAEGFFYPHGVAAALMINLRFPPAGPNSAGVGLRPMMKRILEVRRHLLFETTLDDQSTEQLNLDALSRKTLNYLRMKALGSRASQGDRMSNPITVATVIQGEGGNPSVRVLQGCDLHKALEGLCSWNDTWDSPKSLNSLDTTNLLLDHSQSLPGHMVHHSARGRAVWMPRYFVLQPGPKQHKLSCYHRNLTLVTLQTEMLARAIALHVSRRDQNQPADVEIESLARSAVNHLRFLYASATQAGRKKTYNSASPRSYIDENGYKEDIEKACNAWNLEPLSYVRH